MSQNEQYEEIQIPVPWGYIAGCWYGDRNMRPLLALHGWQDNAGSFARLAPLIAPYRSVLAIDFPGHGRSSHNPAGIPYHTFDYVFIVGRVQRYYKWQRISFLAHSMGAFIAFHYAALFPQHVDMMIAIDKVKTRYFDKNMQIAILEIINEKMLVNNERIMEKQQHSSNEQPEPPMYSFKQLEDLLYEASDHSIALENCKFILQRSVTHSEKHPDKYFFTRDGRLKSIWETYTEPALTLEMAKRIRNVNYLVLKAEDSYHISELADGVLALLRANNPNFEYYSIPDNTHHLHLNNPMEVAQYIVPFVRKYSKSEEKPTRLKAPLNKL